MTWLPVLRLGGDRNMLSVRNEMDSLFNLFLQDWPYDGLIRNGTGTCYPSVDIEENDNEYILRAEIPRMESKDVDISLNDNVLTIKGEKKMEKEEKERNCYHVERRYGRFQRTFQLPANVDSDNVKAECSNGVLTVHIAKSPETKPKKIEIKSA